MAIRPSPTALTAAGNAILDQRPQIVRDWAQWVHSRQISVEGYSFTVLERQLGLLVDILAEMTGPHRRNVTELWLSTAEWYGATSAERGLAAGEVVEEFQHLREILIRDLSETIALWPARQSLATVLRFNRILDQAVAHAVVGYTDRLVETMLTQRGVPVGTIDAAEGETIRRLEQAEQELVRIRAGAPPDQP